jgi:hypothetical protein
MRFYSIFSLLFASLPINAYKLCVVGASSGLGKELVYQTSLNRNSTVLALTTKPFLTTPCRTNSFNEIMNQPIYVTNKVVKENYWNDLSRFKYEHIVFTTGARPFKDDYSDRLMCKILQDLPDTCKTLTLVSAYGVGDSLNKNELGIVAMNQWYLDDVYRAKNEQEKMVNYNMFKNKYPNLKTFILRPRALSYGKTLLTSIPRQDLAGSILDQLEI